MDPSILKLRATWGHVPCRDIYFYNRGHRNDVKVRVSATSKGVVRTMCLGLTLTTDLYLLTLQVLAKSTRGDPHHLTCP